MIGRSYRGKRYEGKKETDAEKLLKRVRLKRNFEMVERVRKLLRRMGRPAPGDIAGMMVISAEDYADLEAVALLARQAVEMEVERARL